MGCGELNFSACLAFFFFPLTFFFLSADSVSRFSHLYFHALPRRLPSLPHLVHLYYLPPSRRAQVALTSLAVLVCGPPPGRKRAEWCNFVSPAWALFGDNNNSRRKASCEGRSNGRWDVRLDGAGRAAQEVPAHCMGREGGIFCLSSQISVLSARNMQRNK